MRFVNGKIVYKCDVCGVEGVKLWREYSTFLDHQSLYCLDCACKNQKKEGITPTEDGKSLYHQTDKWMYRTTIDILDGARRGDWWRIAENKEKIPPNAVETKKNVECHDQIGWLIPAAPTKEFDSFWGYTSVPQDMCEWWYSLQYYLTNREAVVK
jgi:hypothetical protein